MNKGGDGSFTLMVSAVEIYFNDCYDLLNKKAKVPIDGFKAATGANKGYIHGASKEHRDKDGKWIPPYLNGKANFQSEIFSAD